MHRIWKRHAAQKEELEAAMSSSGMPFPADRWEQAWAAITKVSGRALQMLAGLPATCRTYMSWNWLVV